LQKRHGLIGGQEPDQAVRVEPSVAVGNRLEREVIHPRPTCRRAERQTGQLAGVTTRQMPLRRRDLFFDQVEVVEQPVAGGADTLVRSYRGSELLADI